MQNYINYYSQLFHFSFNQEKEQVIPSLMMSYHEMLTVKQQSKVKKWKRKPLVTNLQSKVPQSHPSSPEGNILCLINVVINILKVALTVLHH